MDDVVNADKVSVVRPIDLPSGTYSPDAVVTIDSGNRNEPLKKLPLGELMPKTDGVSVLKGNCADNSITPVTEGDTPEDWDCYEVEKEGEDIWIGIDKRVHAKAGWYHVDMGVYVSRVGSDEDEDENEDEEDNDAVASIWFGAYTGTTPDNQFDYSDYCAIDFDLSYEHVVTPSTGFDIHVANDGDIIHLSVAAPADHTAECYLDWFSIHRIAEVISGGGGGDTPSGNCNVHVIDLQDLEDDLWVECVSALLDGKLLAIRINEGDGDNLGFVCWSEQSVKLPSGYTKDGYIAYLRTVPLYATLTFFARNDVAGVITEGFKFTVSPTVGLRYNYFFILIGGIGIKVTGNSDTGEFGSNDIFNFDYTDPDNPRTTSENLGTALGDVQNRGFPLFLTCRNSNNSFYISGPCYIHYVNPLMLRCHCIADYYEDPAGLHGERLPIDYHLHLNWNADPSWTQTQGYYTIYEDEVYPLALDSRFNGPVSGGEGAR